MCSLILRSVAVKPGCRKVKTLLADYEQTGTLYWLTV
jgi:hypothetical protein